MKKLSLLLVATALLATTACGKKNGETSGSSPAAASGPVASVSPPNGDWSQYVVQIPAGGFVMGNPNAQAKLIEFGSMTCPHCARFEKAAGASIIDNYVKSGKVSWEFRNYIRDGFDLTAALIARCNGPKGFFGLTRGLYASQPDWVAKIQAVPPAQMQQVMSLPPQQQFATIAKLADFPQYAALRGVPAAKSSACLTDTNEVNKLVQMTSDATSQFNIQATPSFVINGSLIDMGSVTEAQVWPTLEAKLKAASGS